MKQTSAILPALITAVFFSVLNLLNLLINSGRGVVQGLVDTVVFSGIGNKPFSPETAISIILDCLLPVLIIELIYGSYVYKSFCNVGIYYFSRQYSRGRWFLRKCAELYLVIFLYILLAIGTKILLYGIVFGISIDYSGVYCLFYYLLHWSLWLFGVTLLINVISLKLTSTGGFMAVFVGQLLCMGSYVLASPNGIVSSFSRGMAFTNAVVRWNPMSHIMIALQKSSNSEVQSRISEILIHENYPLIGFNFSTIYLMIMCLIIIMIGHWLVARFEFLTSNYETGGN